MIDQLVLPDPLNSKKFRAALVAALVAGTTNYFDVDREAILLIIGPFLAFIGMQGIADIGKEKAKVINSNHITMTGSTKAP